MFIYNPGRDCGDFYAVTKQLFSNSSQAIHFGHSHAFADNEFKKKLDRQLTKYVKLILSYIVILLAKSK
jgi:hypothetical protein